MKKTEAIILALCFVGANLSNGSDQPDNRVKTLDLLGGDDC